MKATIDVDLEKLKYLVVGHIICSTASENPRVTSIGPIHSEGEFVGIRVEVYL